ncbi:MAG: DinB family protein [Bacteroidota bacterium]
MEKIIEVIRACRTNWIGMLKQLTTAQLNVIPSGFNNNLAWHFGHVIVSQQILCYRLAGQKFVINEELIDRYKNGSKPESYIGDDEITLLNEYMLSTIVQLEIDLQNGVFDNFKPYTISTYAGLNLESVNDALKFIVSHDALHYGYSMSLKRLVLHGA